MQALALAVFAEVGQAVPRSIARAAPAFATGHGLAAHVNAATRGAQAQQAFKQFGAARAHQAGKTKNLAGAHFEVHRLRPARHAETPHPQRRSTICHHHITRRIQVGQLAAHHEVGHLLARHFCCRGTGHKAAVAHHNHLVGNTLHFVELVRDVDDGHAIGAQLGDQFEQALGLAGGQRGGGLVHDEQARVAGNGLRNLHQLLFGHDQAAHAGSRVRLQADRSECGSGVALHGRIVE